MLLAFEDAVEIEAGLFDGGPGKVIHPGQEVMVLLRRQVVEDAKKCVEDQRKPDPEVPANGVGHGAQQREAVGVVNGHAGED